MREEDEAGKHDEDEWQEKGWVIQGGRFVVPALTWHGVSIEHNRHKRSTLGSLMSDPVGS